MHTVAASNLGQMLNINEGIDIVNIVRRQQHVDLLRSLGAGYVCDSTLATFNADLVEALMATNATLAFDAVGGGNLAAEILSAMEIAQARAGAAIGAYGSTIHEQVYIHGALDRSPTQIGRAFGMAWGVGG